MRVGIQWRGGEITMHVNIEQTMNVFLNGRAAEGAETPDTGPEKVVFYDPKKNLWAPLQPNPYQRELILLSVQAWYNQRHKNRELTTVN